MKNNNNKYFFLKRLVILALILPFVLVWSEVFTRILLPQNVDSAMNIFASNPDIGFIFKPNAQGFEKGKEYNALYKINAQGIRDRDYSRKKEGVFRALLLGDSFSVSHGLDIEDSLSRQIERALQETVNADGKLLKIEIINAAAGGYSPYNYWKAYQYWSRIYNPDAVIIGLSPDDYDCSNANSLYDIEDGRIMSIYRKGKNPKRSNHISFRSMRKWLSWNSEFYILMRNYFYYNEIMAYFTMRQIPGGIEEDAQLQSYQSENYEKIIKTWSKSFEYIKRINDEAVADGIQIVIIRIPLKLEIDEDQYQLVLNMKNLKSNELDLSMPYRIVSTLSDDLNIPVIDPSEILRLNHRKKRSYFKLDGHWNEEGVRVAADSIANDWHEMGISPW